MTNLTTISQKGQIVVPKHIRDALKIKPSDVLNVNLEGKRIIVEPVDSLDEIYGLFKAKKIITKKDIKESFLKHTSEKYNSK